MKKANKNDVWNQIFSDSYHEIKSALDSQGFYDITSDKLNSISKEMGGPDARNLAKFDSTIRLPEVFKRDEALAQNFINIIPIGSINKQYTYRLGRFNAYAPLFLPDENEKPTLIPFPDIKTIQPDDIPSENAFIDAAFTSGMLDQAFDTQGDKLMPVLHGRMGTGEMKFKIGQAPPLPITVKSAQMEIDATFENKHSIVILEAKSVPEPDFLVRQLFYPYYVINNKNTGKPVKPTFLSLLGGNYYFNEYKFLESDNYSTITLVNHSTFRFEEQLHITEKVVSDLFNSTCAKCEPRTAFPQTNSLQKFVATLNLLQDALLDDENIIGGLTQKALASLLNVEPRQGGYYGDLVVYLGLGVRTNSHPLSYKINELGMHLLKEFDTNEGRLQLIKLLFEHVPFRICYQLLVEHNRKVTPELKSQMAKEIFQDSGMYNTKTKNFIMKKSVIFRRLDSTIALIKSAIFNVIEE